MDEGNGQGGAARPPGSEAEELVVALLARGESDSRDLEELCARRPELEAELRALYSDACRGDRALGLTGGNVRSAEQMLRRLAREGPRPARYEAGIEIARGGMGTVREVWDGHLRRRLAMKTVRPPERRADRLERQERMTERFLEEAQITGQLQHPGIVPVHELGVDEDGRPYFTMPHVGGREFRDVLDAVREGRDGWTLARALGVLVKVCQAVGFAHTKGVLHRDLKPANVMVGRFGETYVMDWGLARAMARDDAHDIRVKPSPPPDATAVVRTARSDGSGGGSPLLTMDGDVIGMPAYMAPEQAQGRIERLGPRADVYSIGAMLYHLLTGRPPFPREGSSTSPHTVLAQVLSGPPPPVLEVAPGVAPELAEVCAKAMAREPADRYETALELAADLEAFLESRPVSVHEPSPAYFLRLAWRRNRPFFVTAAAALAAALVWGAVYVRQVRAAWAREQEQHWLAEAARDRTQRVSDASVAQLLLGEADALHAGPPGAAQAMGAWLVRADEVLGRDERHRADLADRPGDAALSELCLGLERLADVRARVAGRRELALGLRARTIDEPRERWERAAREVARSPHYGGLELVPQLGLVPLRPDPVSGLWEFWLPLSGEKPALDAQGRIQLAPETAVVFVLVPGGRVQPQMQGAPYDVEPFFLGKYEVTQAQWERQMGDGYPSYAVLIRVGEVVGPTNPVESVTWNDAHEFASRLGCELPNEFAWEHACRAGSTTAYWWGDDPAGAAGRENLLDDDGAIFVGSPPIGWADGHAIHAPVGSFEPNAYGLHDMAGNVSEWCGNWWPIDVPPRGAGGRRAYRGGGWALPVMVARSGQYQADNPRGLNPARGVRLARALEPAAEEAPR